MSTLQPAPWSIDEYGTLTDANGETVSVNGVSIPSGKRRPDVDPVYANTRLIAAAPELLEALQAAVDCNMVPIISASEGGAAKHSIQAKVADQIRAAIAKATGAE